MWVRETNNLIFMGREGDRDEWRAAVKEYENRYGWGTSYQLAEIFADAGDLDSTFLWLGRAAEVKDPGGPWALVMPFFDEAKEDPRWADYRALFNL